jgi:uncharacterized protein YukE
MEDVLASVDHRTQGPCKELDARIGEMQRDLEMSLGTWTRSLHEGSAETKKDLYEEMADTKNLHKELDRKILKARVDIQATNTQVEAT